MDTLALGDAVEQESSAMALWPRDLSICWCRVKVGTPLAMRGIGLSPSFCQDCHCSIQCKGTKLIPQVGSKWKEVVFMPQWQWDSCGDGCKQDELLRRGMNL